MPATDQPIFSAQQLQQLLARVRPLVADQMDQHAKIQERLTEFAGDGAPHSLRAQDSDSDAMRELKLSLQSQIHAYERGWNRLEGLGAIIRDPARGVLAFYGRVEGRVVWFWWQHDEPDATYFHELNSDVMTRQPIRSQLN